MSSEEPDSYRTTDDPTNSKIENGEGKNRLLKPNNLIVLQPESSRPRSVSADIAANKQSGNEGEWGGREGGQADSYTNSNTGNGVGDSSRPFVKMMTWRPCLPMMSRRRRPKVSFMQEEDPFIELKIDNPTITDNNQTKNGGLEGGERAKLDSVVIMKEKLSHKPSCCIYRVPQAFHHDGNEKAYVPQIVSIGPFHHGKQSLQPMEEYKLWYQQFLLPRNGGFMSSESLLGIVKSLGGKAREHYSETIDLDSNAFAEMMFLDCCFLIALFLKKGKFIRYKDDPIFKMRWVMPALRRDLLLLENQVPFSILQFLFDKINNQAYRRTSLDKLALHFFNDCRPYLDMNLKHDQKDKPLHLLHLFYNSLIPKQFRKKPKGQFQPVSRINSITKLQDAGLKLKKCKSESFLDIRFKDHGILEIPPLKIQDFTCSQLLNLVAFEQCYHGVRTPITTYALFMDCLIDSPEDVEILCQDGIIDNWLGNNEQVANLFNKLCRGVVIQIERCYLSDVFSEVNKYCGRKWPSWREKLMREYFQSPWAIISVVGAIFLLILTIAQATIAFVAYYVPPSS